MSTSILVAALAVIALILAVVRFAGWQIVKGLAHRTPESQPQPDRTHHSSRDVPVRAGRAVQDPRLADVPAARVDPVGFTRLPLTLIALAALVPLACLGGLVALIHIRHGTVGFDQAADDFFKPYRAPWLLKAAAWITAIGAGPSLAAMLGVATALLWSGSRRPFIAPLWVSFLGAQATTWTSKYIIARPRPAFLPGITEWNPSFPSGHATATTALIGMLGLVVAASLPGLRARFEVGFWTVVIVALICFSRIFLGVHFVTDVAAGVLVGVIWLLVGYTVGARGRHRRGGD